jgi:hypothetical protein
VNKPITPGTPRRFSDRELAVLALRIQDGCNLAGVAYTFWEIVCGIPVEQRKRHPAIVLFVSKIESLAGTDGEDVDAFSNAYRACQQLAGEPK